MIGFSITTWCIAVIMLCLGISLLKGNYTFVHGKVFDRTKDKAGYAKQFGKPVLLVAVVTIGLFYRVDKYFCKSLSE